MCVAGTCYNHLESEVVTNRAKGVLMAHEDQARVDTENRNPQGLPTAGREGVVKEHQERLLST